MPEAVSRFRPTTDLSRISVAQAPFSGAVKFIFQAAGTWLQADAIFLTHSRPSTSLYLQFLILLLCLAPRHDASERGDWALGSAYTPSLLTLYFARLVSLLGDRIYLVALMLYLVEKDSRYLALLGIIRFGVPILTTLFEGILVDRFGAKRTAIASDIVNFVATGLMAFTLHRILPLFLLIVVASGSTSFFNTASTPLIAHLTHEKNRHRVNSIMSTLQSIALFGGPLIAGTLFLTDPRIPFLLQSASYAISALCILSLPVARIARLSSEQSFTARSAWANFRFVARYVLTNPLLRYGLLVFILINLGAGMLDYFQVVFLTKSLGFSIRLYTLFASVYGLSFVFAGFVNVRAFRNVRPAAIVPVGTALLLAGLAGFALSFNFWSAIAGVVVGSIGMTAVLASIRTIRMNEVPQELLGRITAFSSNLATSSAVVSILLGGALLPYLSIRYLFIGAVMLMIPCLPMGLFIWNASLRTGRSDILEKG